jgi:hypothetical protein
METLMNDHADSASNDKPKLYYGVRKCDSLEGPAIFLNWSDCKFFVGSEKYDNIEYQSFERIVDAASYVTFQKVAAANNRPAIAPKAGSSSHASLKRSADQASLPSPSGSPKKKLPKIPTLTPSTISDDTTETDSAYGNHAETSTTDRPEPPRGSAPISKKHRDVAGRLKESNNVHGTASVVSEDCCEERFMGLYGFLGIWSRTVKRITDGREKPAHTSSAKIWKLIDLGVDLGVDPETICKPESASFSYRGHGVHASFERDIQLLKEYKEIYGTTVILPDEQDCCEERFKGLCRFLVRWRCTVKRITDGRNKPTHTSFAKIWKLIDLGVDLGVDPETICKPEPASFSYKIDMLNYAFEKDIQLLKEYKEIYGTTVVMPEEHCYQGHFKERLWEHINVQRWAGYARRQGQTSATIYRHRV